ncbi:hypothetical protein F5887DRAFT_1082973 [Amanita rubescens]|nr:hypothetical protein F5887DRAFT_1082973 [Amanita rubescens]
MTIATRAGRSRRPPLNRDEAMVPITQRQTEPRPTNALPASGALNTDPTLNSGNTMNVQSATSTIESSSGAFPDSVADVTRNLPSLFLDVIDLTSTDECMNWEQEDVSGTDASVNEFRTFGNLGPEFDIMSSSSGDRIITAPEQTDAQFQELIAAANGLGIVYTSRKGKEKEVRAVSENGEDTVITSPWRKETKTQPGTGEHPSSSGHPIIEDANDNKLSVLMVSTQCPRGTNSHTMFTVMTRDAGTPGSPVYVVDLYDALQSSQQLESRAVNMDINGMDESEIQLATAGIPVFMDDSNNFGRSWTGFRPLGFLKELDVDFLIKPVRESEDKSSMMDLYNQDPTLDLYILYVWEGKPNVPSRSMKSSTPQAIATTSTAPAIVKDLVQQYHDLFQKLVLRKNGENESAFALFMFVRIVTDVCAALGIPCGRRVAIFTKFQAGNEQICIADVVEAFKDGTTAYRSPNTFKNYRGLKLNAEALLEYMEREGMVTSPRDIRYITRARQLLSTPLEEAAHLVASWYGKIKNFDQEVKQMARLCNWGSQLTLEEDG